MVITIGLSLAEQHNGESISSLGRYARILRSGIWHLKDNARGLRPLRATCNVVTDLRRKGRVAEAQRDVT